MNRIIRLATAIMVTTLVCGCTFSHKLKIEPQLDALPQTTKSTTHAGVYYSPQFADQESSRIIGNFIWSVPIGAVSVRLFDNLLPRVFEKTTRISKVTADEMSMKGVDLVIAPSLDHFDFRSGMDADNDRYSVSYRMTLYTKRGVPVASWVVLGNATGKTMGSMWGMIEDDMTDAAAKFLNGFERDAGLALTAIAKNPGGQSIVVDPKNIILGAKRGELPSLDAKQVAALKEAGVVILQVTVRSDDTERQLVVRASDMRLRLKDGQLIEPSSASSILNMLEQTSQTGDVVAGLFGAPFGVLTTFSENSSNEAKRELQLRTIGQSLFMERTLSKGKEETAVVFFRLPKDIKAEDGVTLTAWVVDPDLAEGTQIEVSLPSAK